MVQHNRGLYKGLGTYRDIDSNCGAVVALSNVYGTYATKQ